MSDPPESVRLGRGIVNKLNLNAGLEITAVTDDFDSDYMDSKQKIRQLKPIFQENENATIKFKVISPQIVSLWIEYVPSAIHDEFYENYRTKDFNPPRVVILIDRKRYLSGEHSIRWNGRDQTPDRRLLLAGKYRIKLTGSGLLKPQDETKIEIDWPAADLYGIHYRIKRRWETTKKEVNAAVKALGALQDGTKYGAFAFFDATADSLLDTFAETSVSYLSGHSGPLNFNLHAKEGATFSKKDKSVLFAMGEQDPPSASLEQVSDDKFADMFLVMFNGCLPANELYVVQLFLNKCFPGGFDYKHGKKTTRGLRNYQVLVGLTPEDGTKNDPTLTWFGIDKNTTDARTQTGVLQKKLRSYYCGDEDGKWGDKTEKAVRNFQRDHPRLVETGVVDQVTLDAMSHFKDFNQLGRNVAEAMMKKGTDLAFGFEHKVGFKDAEAWAINFWNTAAKGKGIMSSANDATANLDVRKRKQFIYKIYAQEGVSKDSKLHPARYGRYSK